MDFHSQLLDHGKNRWIRFAYLIIDYAAKILRRFFLRVYKKRNFGVEWSAADKYRYTIKKPGGGFVKGKGNTFWVQEKSLNNVVWIGGYPPPHSHSDFNLPWSDTAKLKLYYSQGVSVHKGVVDSWDVTLLVNILKNSIEIGFGLGCRNATKKVFDWLTTLTINRNENVAHVSDSSMDDHSFKTAFHSVRDALHNICNYGDYFKETGDADWKKKVFADIDYLRDNLLNPSAPVEKELAETHTAYLKAENALSATTVQRDLAQNLLDEVKQSYKEQRDLYIHLEREFGSQSTKVVAWITNYWRTDIDPADATIRQHTNVAGGRIAARTVRPLTLNKDGSTSAAGVSNGLQLEINLDQFKARAVSIKTPIISDTTVVQVTTNYN
jgi:hypothetical protein